MSVLPALSDLDIQQAIRLIQQAYNPANGPDATKTYQQELVQLQQRPEAWGLVVPLLNFQGDGKDYVQFFGAHTAQVRITRGLEGIPVEAYAGLRDTLLELTVHALQSNRPRLVMTKLFVVLSSLALKIAPRQWPRWVLSCIEAFSAVGTSNERIFEFLTIAVEEVKGANLTGPRIGEMNATLSEAVSVVAPAMTASLATEEALRCLRTWISVFPSDQLTPLIPPLISLLVPTTNPNVFVATSDTLQDFLCTSPLSSATRTLAEPLFVWFSSTGKSIIDSAVQARDIDDISFSVAKLLVELADASSSWMIINLTSPSHRDMIRTALSLLVSLTSFPGYYGVDEEVSERTLAFWCQLQEEVWESTTGQQEMQERDATIKTLYVEVVKALRQKCKWPPPGHGWSKDQITKFQSYRRDVGDTLITAYYILRDDMLKFLINDVEARLAARQQQQSGEQGTWEEIETSLHCISSIQEALDYDNTPDLGRLFSPAIMNHIPQTGHGRVRRTVLSLIAVYASWFLVQPQLPELHSQLSTVVTYIISALPDHHLCIPASQALRNLCDANRRLLSTTLLGVLAQVYSNLEVIPDEVKSKVVESIASVVQALPVHEQVGAVDGIVGPLLSKLEVALQLGASGRGEEARTLILLYVETICGIVKGLTRLERDLVAVHNPRRSTAEEIDLGADVFSLEVDVEELDELQLLQEGWADPRMVGLRQRLGNAVGQVVALWGGDVGISVAVTSLLTASTSLPSDMTLISLPPTPVLAIACQAIQVPGMVIPAWITLFGALFIQLFPQPLKYPLDNPDMKARAERIQWGGRSEEEMRGEAQAVVNGALPLLLSAVLPVLSGDGLSTNPDVAQALFSVMEQLAGINIKSFYTLPSADLFHALIDCSVRGVMMQERYAQVQACLFLTKLISQSYNTNKPPHIDTSIVKSTLIQPHGKSILRAVFSAIVGVVPRSCMPNVVGLLTTILGKWVDECRVWVREVLYAPDFTPSKTTPEAKDRFIKAILGSRSNKKTTEAVSNFTLVARGLEGSGFGWSASTQ